MLVSQLKLENFQGIKTADLEFDGQVVVSINVALMMCHEIPKIADRRYVNFSRNPTNTRVRRMLTPVEP